MSRIVGVLATTVVTVTVILSFPGAKSGATPVQVAKRQADTRHKCLEAAVVAAAVRDVPEAPHYSGRRISARVVKYRDLQGDVTEERVPVQAWQPATATAEERAFFHIPAEPAAGSATHTKWAHEWIDRFSRVELAPPCEPVGTNSATFATANWSGMVSAEGSVTGAFGSTHYITGSPCAIQPDSFTNWVGIGGWNNTALIQNGFWVDHNAGSYPFWEALNPHLGLDTHTVAVSFAASGGDAVNLSTSWNGSQALFGYHDLTNGATASLIEGTILNRPASDFYSGSSGEVIDERGMINSRLTTLRNFGFDHWTLAQVGQSYGALRPIRAVAHDGLIMQANGYTYATAGDPAQTLDAFTDAWNSCGVTG